MNFARALAGFVGDAARNLRRGWKASLLAALSIAVSLFLVGFFHLLARNLEQRAATWRAQARVLVYAQPDAAVSELARLEARLRAEPWARGVRRVEPAEALDALREAAPAVADLIQSTEPVLPTSFEIEPHGGKAGSAASGTAPEPAPAPAEIRALLETDPAVLVVEDDREWLGPLESAATALRVTAWMLVGVLLGAALLTIGAVIRLKAFLDSDEIGVLRLVGGTEFYIRGPFYAEGLLLGAAGGGLALGTLRLTTWFLGRRLADWPGISSLLTEFLPLEQAVGLVGLGAVAGLAGAIVSLRREQLGPIADPSS